MHKTENAMMIAAGITAATAAVAAAGYAATQNNRKVKKTAKKVARGAERAILDLDKTIHRYW